jgi:hypothetical protein
MQFSGVLLLACLKLPTFTAIPLGLMSLQRIYELLSFYIYFSGRVCREGRFAFRNYIVVYI